jgi:hypothetical protein
MTKLHAMCAYENAERGYKISNFLNVSSTGRGHFTRKKVQGLEAWWTEDGSPAGGEEKKRFSCCELKICFQYPMSIYLQLPQQLY